jgi:hypothetical protein
MIGTKLDAYEIQAEIGAGGMGTVYRGQQTLTLTQAIEVALDN